MGRSAYRTKAENPVSILNRDFYHSDGHTNSGADQGNTNGKRILIVTAPLPPFSSRQRWRLYCSVSWGWRLRGVAKIGQAVIRTVH
jgi:hypothetical protein